MSNIYLVLYLLTTFGVLSKVLPTQIHLALTGIESSDTSNCSIVVSWATAKGQVPASCSVVSFGPSTTVLDSAQGGTPRAYKAAKYDFHHVVLHGLHCGSKYYYKCGCKEFGWSNVLQFTAPQVL